LDTYNVYMDEASADGLNGESEVDVNFRIVAASTDTEDAEENAVIVGLDLIDLMNLRDALQNEIDSFTLLQFEANALAGTDELEDEDLP
jgi:aryl carrier-like protein